MDKLIEEIMKALVIFDTNYGNTKLVADIIAGELGEGARSVSTKDLMEPDLVGIDVLVVGSPIIGWRPSDRMGKFLRSLGRGRLKGLKAAAFDTRVKMFISGDAAKKISRALNNVGAEIIVRPQAFYVRGKAGPLLDGEIERAKDWARSIRTKI
jgi:flavodoxin